MKKITTSIWFEESHPENEFSPSQSYLHGENFFGKLCGSLSFCEMIWFHFLKKKPSRKQREWLELLLNFSSNPGIRDESTRTAMNVAVGKGPLLNSVLSGILARSGDNLGAQWLENAMDTLQKHFPSREKLRESKYSGLGMHFGALDSRAQDAWGVLSDKKYIGRYSLFLHEAATPKKPELLEGIIAAGFLDLGLSPIQGATLFLLAPIPGFLVFSEEQWQQGYKNYPNYFTPGSYHYIPEPKKSEVKHGK
jgi:hypothetical protein